MSLQCHSCAQTMDRGERCLGPDLESHHQAPRVRVTRSRPGELLKPGRKRFLWRYLERHCCRAMLEYLLKTSRNVFCQHCLRRERSEVEQSIGAGAKLSGRRPPAHWTGIGPVNEGIMFGQLSVSLFCFRFLFFVFEECAWVYGNACVSECL